MAVRHSLPAFVAVIPPYLITMQWSLHTYAHGSVSFLTCSCGSYPPLCDSVPVVPPPHLHTWQCVPPCLRMWQLFLLLTCMRATTLSLALADRGGASPGAAQAIWTMPGIFSTSRSRSLRMVRACSRPRHSWAARVKVRC